ncbi:MAG TPA: hypothetical protein EYN67_16010 [Flavobacteriales bacterium]|nr:hypothetical protein [Flavobacteriales bacterium]
MEIYKIHVQHFSQKDSHSSIEAFLLAESVDDVYKWVDEKVYGCYTDQNDEGDALDIYDENYNVIGQETFKEKMLRVGGEFFDEDYEPQDLYYGCTIYGWKKVKSDVSEVDIAALEKLDVLINLVK